MLDFCFFFVVFSFNIFWGFLFLKIATPVSEIDEGIRPDLEASAMPMDAETTTGTGNTSLGGSPMPDEQQKQSSDTDAGQETGQLEADAEVGAGMIDGEPDTEVDLDPTT